MFPTHIRYSALAAAFNISVLIAGLTPTLAAAGGKLAGSDDAGVLFDGHRGDRFDYRYFHERDGQSSAKGATPAASDIREAKEILGEHYDNIEQKIDDIDQEIAELQVKRSRLVQQHPRIDE